MEDISLHKLYGGNKNHSGTCQQDDSGIPFVVASQKMKDSVSMSMTKQLVQRNIDSFFQRI